MVNVNPFPQEVADQEGYIYRLISKPLGQGGQGVVFRTSDPDTAVKIITDENGQPLLDPQARGRFSEKLEGVRLLPVPDLHLAKPKALLRPPFIGYSMKLLGSMVPMNTLIAPAGGSLSSFYVETGGLRRRLRLLAKAAEILARLHAIPLVYADVSANNIFISESLDDEEVWFIDADNLDYACGVSPAIHTPSYGAPEVVRGTSGVNTLSDAYSFAIMAYWILSQQHPFIGDAVDDEGGWDSVSINASGLEEKAFAGELPWIHDLEDPINRTGKGIPPEIVMMPSLMGLFQSALSQGRLMPEARPGMQAWVDVLHQAADFTLTCQGCGSSYYAKASSCPWCGSARPSFLYLEARRWDPDLDEDEYDPATGGKIAGVQDQDAGSKTSNAFQSKPVWRQVIDYGKPAGIRRHLLAPTIFRDGDPVMLEVEFLRQGIRLTKSEQWLGEMELSIWLPETRQNSPINDSITLPLPKAKTPWHIHCGSSSIPHRVVSLLLHGDI